MYVPFGNGNVVLKSQFQDALLSKDITEFNPHPMMQLLFTTDIKMCHFGSSNELLTF